MRLAGADAKLTIEQTTPMPAETLERGKHNEITLRVTRESPERAVYWLLK